MKTVYLDNAATTQIEEQVIEIIHATMRQNYGNPSSVHQFGRRAKAAVEMARKNISSHFNVSARELIFTAGGTEADNLILHNAVFNLGIKRIITSKIEHHAVLRTCNYLEKTQNTTVLYVATNEFGTINLEDLEVLLKSSKEKTLVSLMLINNEIGNLLDAEKVAVICKNNNALFHSDTVQAVAHYPIDLQKTPIDFIVASAHKFHGPKGVGFAYFKKGFGILPMLYGGEQEKGARSSTENVHAILGMEKALEIAIFNLEKDRKYIENIKKYFISELKKSFINIAFNGLSSNLNESSYTILNVRFPYTNDLLLFRLDMAGVAVSGASACQSGGNKNSHVLSEILKDVDVAKTSIRFSFSKYTTRKEIDFVMACLNN